MADYKAAAAIEAESVKRKKEAKARILMRVGDAERVESEDFTLSAKEIGEVVIESYTRKAYRDFRIHERKAK